MPKKSVAKKKQARKYDKTLERVLWGRAAGRCESKPCNRLVYLSQVSRAPVNHSEKAHIWPFSEQGPRGNSAATKPNDVNGIDNIMLLCGCCHDEIDEHPEKFPVELLRRWKAEHEARVKRVTGIDPLRHSHVLIYAAGIDGERLQISKDQAFRAIFSLDWFPADDHPIPLSVTWDGRDSNPEYWAFEKANLEQGFERYVRPVLSRTEFQHLSIFGLAPMPLLIRLGTLVTERVQAQVYQRHRDPEATFDWPQGEREARNFELNRPEHTKHRPVLILSLTSKIDKKRVTSVLGNDVSIWELTTESPDPEIIKSPLDLASFRNSLRKTIIEIDQSHGKVPLSIFPAMPASCAIETGRVRFSKADMPWVLYDHSNVYKKFIEAFTIQ